MSTREDFEAWFFDEVEKNNAVLSDLEAMWLSYQAATTRQTVKIKALRKSLNWALSNFSEEPFEWSNEEDADAHKEAIAAAKEQS